MNYFQGAHINPAVSFAMLIMGRMKVKRFVVYVLGQFIGAFLGALFVYINYYDAIHKYDEATNFGLYSMKTAGIFGTYPSSEVTVFGGLFDQFYGSSLLIIVVLAITDPKNSNLPSGTVAIVVGITITIIGSSFGYNSGFAINPARDLAPRIFTAIAGWGTKVFTEGNYFFWIPVIGPMIGSSFAALVYTFLISNNWTE